MGFLSRMGKAGSRKFMSAIAECLRVRGRIALPITAKKAEDIMNCPAITVHEKSTFSEISGLMAEKVISKVPVTDNGSSVRLWRPIGCRVRDALNSDALRDNLHLWHDRSCFSIEAF